MITFVAALLMFAPFADDHSARRPASSEVFDSLAHDARTARDAGKTADAMRFYERALKMKPDWEEGLWDFGTLAYDSNQYRDGAAAFLKVSSIRPQFAPAWIMAGLCQFEMSNYGDALDAFRHAEYLRFDGPKDLSRAARLDYALVLGKTRGYEKALLILTELVRIDRKSQEIIVAAGISGLRRPWLPAEVPESEREKVYRLGDAMASVMEMDNKTGIEKFEAVEKSYPNDPEVHFRFGAFLMQQQPDRGIEEIGRALELDPHNLGALVSLTSIYRKRDDMKSALIYAKKAVEAGPENFETYVSLGRVLLDTDDVAAAAFELENAVKLAPNSADAHFSLATAYSRLGRRQDAAHEQEEFKRLKKLSDPTQP